MPDYLWLAEDGMKMQGYNGSQTWDTAFAAQAVAEAGLAAEFPQMCRSAYRFFERSQVRARAVAEAAPGAAAHG